jgi:chromate transporter
MSVFSPAIGVRTCFRRSWREPWRGCWSRGLRSRPAFFGSSSVYVEALRGARALGAALSAVTAAVVGVILNLAVWFGIHVIFRETVPLYGFGLNLSLPVLPSLDLFATVLAIAAALAIFRFKVGIMQTLLACSLAGVALQLVFGGAL